MAEKPDFSIDQGPKESAEDYYVVSGLRLADCVHSLSGLQCSKMHEWFVEIFEAAEVAGL